MADLICIEGDCEVGEQLVEEMLATYRHHFHGLADEEFRRFHARYGAAVNAIRTAYESAQDSWDRSIPFTPTCCTIKRLGVQAQRVTKAMNAWTGSESPSEIDTRGPFQATTDKLLALGIVGVLFLVLMRGGK